MAKINTDKEKIQGLLTRGVAKVYPSEASLAERLKSGKQLSLYLGIDPTGPSLHLGHSIQLLKLAQWQAMGHKVILLIGDFTATIGDPTDKMAARKPLTKAQVLKNAKDYQKQANSILRFTGPNKAEIKYNSAWLAKMNLADMLSLAAKFTVGQLLERDMFQDRIKSGKAISLHEFLYPVLQAYDCVAMDVDGELGGNDQTFNMLAGRTLMKSMKGKDKFVMTTQLLTDSAGAKMGKTTGNMLTLNSKPSEMFGTIMSWTDSMIVPGFELCTNMDMKYIHGIAEQIKKGDNPRNHKYRLASEIVTIYYNRKTAEQAGDEFVTIFSKGGRPDKIVTHKISPRSLSPVDLLVKLKFVSSKSEAKRLIDGDGMRLNDSKVADWRTNINIKSGDIVQAGKRKFGKIK